MNKKEIIPKPYGYTTMLRLAYAEIGYNGFWVVQDFINGYAYGETEQYPIRTLWTYIWIVYALFVVTWTESLQRKKSQENLDQIRIYLLIDLIMTVLVGLEDFYDLYPYHQDILVPYFVYFLVHIFIIIYWNNPIHDRYMKSGS